MKRKNALTLLIISLAVIGIIGVSILGMRGDFSINETIVYILIFIIQGVVHTVNIRSKVDDEV